MSKVKHLESKFSIASYELIRMCQPEELQFYLYLKLYAINKSNAFPSYSAITNDLNWARTRITRTVRKMEESGRLIVDRTHRMNNTYDITWYDRQVTKASSIPEAPIFEERNATQTSSETLLKLGAKRYSNEYTITKRKVTNKKEATLALQVVDPLDVEIPEIIDAFKVVNPSYGKWYGNTTQRAAISRLLKTHGKEQILKVVRILPRTNLMEYVTTITTPIQLEDKYAALEASLRKKKQSSQDKVFKIGSVS